LIYYQAPDLRRIAQDNYVRNARDAARIFAHRLARKLLGRNGRCLAVKESIRASATLASFEAEVGTARHGYLQTIHIPVRTVRS